jgi:chorismate mutase
MESKSDLETLRKDIDRIDQNLVSVLAERFRITNQIGQYKRAQNLSPVDEQREQQQFLKIKKLASKAGLNPQFAENFLRCIIDEVVRNHKQAQ